MVAVGETLAFQIDNRFPGGEPRTIGYWKNWNTCTSGNQALTAANNGGPAEGWFILDDLLNNAGYTIGNLQLGGSDCRAAVDILDKRDIDTGKKRASDAAYNLASQLLAAQLNLSAGAERCQAVVDAVNGGQTVLADIGFEGMGSHLKGRQAESQSFMTDLVDELWTQRPALEEAQRRGGPVLLTGLGLGLVVDALLATTPAEQVTVVEASADVVALVAPYLRDRHGAAVEVVHADAFAWAPPPGARFTVGWHDIWPNHADPACEPESRRLFARYAPHCDWQGSWALQYRTDEAAALQAR